MTQPAPPAAPAAAPDPQPGFFGRTMEHLHPHPGTEAAVIAGDLKAAIRDHAGQCFDIAGDVLAVLKLADPADAAAMELAGKVIALAASAAHIAGAARSA